MTADQSPNVLAQLSDALAAAVATAAAATVTVHARRRVAASGVVWRTDGVIITADHVIEREEAITLTLADGRQVAATLAGRDPGTDLAVLRVSGTTGLTAAHPAPAGSAHVGHIVLAVGRPAPEGPSASLGVISVAGGPWRTSRGAQVEGYYRTDTTFFPGFSGGPLVDTSGRVIGINSSHLGRGAGLTLPASAVEQVVAQLLAGGRIRRGFLGIGSQPARLPEALAAKVGGQTSGLLIVNVEPSSPAAAGGLLIGDILIALGGAPIRDTDDLQAQLDGNRVGQPVALTILRGGERAELTVTVGERS